MLGEWYPASPLDMDETARTHRRTRFGGEKFVYPAATMREIKAFFHEGVAELMPTARILYFT